MCEDDNIFRINREKEKINVIVDTLQQAVRFTTCDTL